MSFPSRAVWLRIVAVALGSIALSPATARATVTSATLSANPATYSGPCPVTIAFSGSIQGTPGPVSWQFAPNGVPAALQSSVIPASGQLSVSDSIVVTSSASGYDQIIVPVPHVPTRSAQAAYMVTCVAASTTPAPTPQPVHPVQQPLRPCPTCVVHTYTLQS
ncbi:MAG: hypothetical protein JO293_03750, partial [Candidatus Eremiobacteraeota bacterium]|nr:hypothetical protein [Candidatus Eremiobacteraeota bacterium]